MRKDIEEVLIKEIESFKEDIKRCNENYEFCIKAGNEIGGWYWIMMEFAYQDCFDRLKRIIDPNW